MMDNYRINASLSIGETPSEVILLPGCQPRFVAVHLFHTSGSPTFGKMTDQIVTGVYKDATMNDKHAYDEYSIYILYV